MIKGGLNLVVFTPSKAKIDMDVEEKKLKFPPYVTPVLCGPEHYDLMKEALLFQQNEEKVKMPTCFPLLVLPSGSSTAFSMSATMSSTLRTLSGMVVCPSSCLFGPLFFLGS